MRTAALVYAGSLSEHALSPLRGTASAYDRCLAFVGALPGLERAAIAAISTVPTGGPYPLVVRERWTVDALLEEVARVGEGLDAVFLVWADLPFLDLALARRMLENFHRYRAEYGFADGYPVGLATEIVAPRIVPALRSLASSLPAEIARDSLFTVVQKDINSFDIETEISPKDLRDLRLVLACDSKRNRLLVERLLEAGVQDEKSALATIPERLDLLRTLPAFVQIQIEGGCLQSCALCPWPTVGGNILERRDHMPRERYAAILDQVVELCGDAVIDLSLWGEPSLHPDIGGLIEETLSRRGLSLIVETSGLGWNRALVESLAASWPERLHWIVSLDAPTSELYGQLRGQGYAEATAFAEYLIALFPKTAYVQTVRVRENEENLELFWRGWKKKTENVIVQKYSTFAGLLPERKVSDLSPLSRRPCWHLKRDLSILLDGSVLLCRECARKEIVLGDVFRSAEGGAESDGLGLERAWKAGEAYHLAHVLSGAGKAEYPSPCGACDEYYTYNA